MQAHKHASHAQIGDENTHEETENQIFKNKRNEAKWGHSEHIAFAAENHQIKKHAREDRLFRRGTTPGNAGSTGPKDKVALLQPQGPHTKVEEDKTDPPGGSSQRSISREVLDRAYVELPEKGAKSKQRVILRKRTLLRTTCPIGMDLKMGHDRSEGGRSEERRCDARY